MEGNALCFYFRSFAFFWYATISYRMHSCHFRLCNCSSRTRERERERERERDRERERERERERDFVRLNLAGTTAVSVVACSRDIVVFNDAIMSYRT